MKYKSFIEVTKALCDANKDFSADFDLLNSSNQGSHGTKSFTANVVKCDMLTICTQAYANMKVQSRTPFEAYYKKNGVFLNNFKITFGAGRASADPINKLNKVAKGKSVSQLDAMIAHLQSLKTR